MKHYKKRYKMKLIKQTLLALSLCVITANAFADTELDYKAGVRAFINQNYEQAQSSWLLAAKQNHARSMFNLGLLHEQNKVAGSSPEKAERWFNLAADAGYPAASFHLAKRLLAKDNNDPAARQHLKRASRAGYFPAKQLLASMGSATSVASANSNVSSSSHANAGGTVEPVGTDVQNQLSFKYQSQQWIQRQPAQNWTIQLLAFTELEKVKAFIDLHGIHQRAAYFVENRGGETLYKLIYGSFNSKDQAETARERLTPSLQTHGPWLRTMESVQKVITP